MKFSIRQILMLMILFGLFFGLAVSLSKKPVSNRPVRAVLSPDGTKLVGISDKGLATLYDLEFPTAAFRSKQFGTNEFFGWMSASEVVFLNDTVVAVAHYGDGGESGAHLWNLDDDTVEEKASIANPSSDVYVSSKYLIKYDGGKNQLVLEDWEEKNGPIVIKSGVAQSLMPIDRSIPVYASDDGQKMMVISSAATTGDTIITMFDISTASELSNFTLNDSWNQLFSCSRNLNYVFRSSNGRGTLYDQDLNLVEKSFHISERDDIWGRGKLPVAFSVNEDLMAVAEDDLVKIYELQTMEVRNSLAIKNANRRAFSFNEDASQLYVLPYNANDGLEIWDVSSESMIQRVGQVQRALPGIAFGLGFSIWALIWGIAGRKRFVRSMQTPNYNGDPNSEIASPLEDTVVSLSGINLVDDHGTTVRNGTHDDFVDAEIVGPVSIGYDPSHVRAAPKTVRAIWTLMLIGGIWGVFYASVSVFFVARTGMTLPEIFLFSFRLVATFFLLATSLLALTRGIGRYPNKMTPTSIMQIVSVLAFDFINCFFGFIQMLLMVVGDAPHYFAAVKRRQNSKKNG